MKLTAKRTLVLIAAAVLLLLVVIGLAVYFNLNGIVRRGVEKQSTASLTLPTHLDGAHLSIFGGSVSLDDLKIASPQGYSAPHMLTADDIDLQTSLTNLRADPIRVTALRVYKPTVVIEHQSGKFNFQTLTDLPPNPNPPKLVIDTLDIQSPTVILRPNLPGLATEIPLTLPSLQLKNIGTGPGAENGAQIKDVVATLLTKLAGQATQSDQLPPELRQLLSLNVDQAIAQLEQRVGAEIEKHTTAATQRLEKELDKTLDKAFGNLLGDKKDDKKKKP